MPSNLSLYIDKHDAVRSFCASAKELYPGSTWLSVQELLALAWARHGLNDPWPWDEVRVDIQQRWEDARWDGFGTLARAASY
jgi:hypothetical protein